MGDPAGWASTTSPTRRWARPSPHGVNDIEANTGWVDVGTDHDTVAFAVESIHRWWHGQGQDAYRGDPAACHCRCGRI